MDEIYVYCVPLPASIHEIVTPCADGYTVYIADWLDDQKRLEAYNHALRHITNHDFERTDVQQIEGECHAES